jgi:3-deoxy-D-manno-octulosonic-acid transferase
LWSYLYDIILLPFSICLYIARPLLTREFRERLGETGFRKGNRVYWFHCASVGELSAISGLIQEVRKRENGSCVVISTNTKTGKKRARQLFPDLFSFLAPVDSRIFVSAALRRINPDVLIIAETEIWPNLVRLSAKSGARIVMVNGRLTARSLKRYLSFRPLFARALREVTWFYVQTESDRVRFEKVGAFAQRIAVTGSVKSDIQTPCGSRDSVAEEFRLPKDKRIFVAGSVRPGEEKDILLAFQSLLSREPRVYLLLAPRHIQRARAIGAMAEEMGFKVRYRSDSGDLSNDQILVLDTIGELAKAYGAADVAFVGGTLASYGGHNLLEPAAWGVPVLFGRHTENCREEAEELIGSGGGMRVNQAEDLASKVSLLLQNDELRVEFGGNAKAVVMRRSGVSRRIYEDLCRKRVLGY